MCAFSAVAQIDSTSTGQVVDAEIIIEKEKEIRLPISEKQNTGPIKYTQTIKPLSLKYKNEEPGLDWPSYKSEVNVLSFNNNQP